MNLKRIAIQLENGLKLDLKLLAFKESDAVYKKYLAKFDDAPHTLHQDMYKAVFHFKTATICAFCHSDAVSLIIQLFGNYNQARALDYFECFVVNNHAVYNSRISGERNPILTVLKRSIEQNVSPNLTALLASKT